MDAKHRKRKLLGQNLLKSPTLVRRLVAQSQICSKDVVYEIGPGRGIITAELARRARIVIAVERDPVLTRQLRQRFAKCANVKIVQGDFLEFRIREHGDHVVFASVPFGITAEIMRMLLNDRYAKKMFLVLQREAAMKYSGVGGETIVSLTAKPRFSFEIVHRFRRSDFVPEPAVDSVLLKVVRREKPLIAKEDEKSFREFVRLGFCSWRPSLRLALKRCFGYQEWKRLSRELQFPIGTRPSEVRFEQWLGLFERYKSKT